MFIATDIRSCLRKARKRRSRRRRAAPTVPGARSARKPSAGFRNITVTQKGKGNTCLSQTPCGVCGVCGVTHWNKTVCRFKTSSCVGSKRPRVHRHHAHMCFNMYAWCRYTRGRFESTHGCEEGERGRASSPVLRTKKIAHGGLSLGPRGSPKKPLNLTHFQV